MCSAEPRFVIRWYFDVRTSCRANKDGLYYWLRKTLHLRIFLIFERSHQCLRVISNETWRKFQFLVVIVRFGRCVLLWWACDETLPCNIGIFKRVGHKKHSNFFSLASLARSHLPLKNDVFSVFHGKSAVFQSLRLMFTREKREVLSTFQQKNRQIVPSDDVLSFTDLKKLSHPIIANLELGGWARSPPVAPNSELGFNAPACISDQHLSSYVFICF